MNGISPTLNPGGRSGLIRPPVETMRQADELARVHGDKRQQVWAASQLSFALWLIGEHQTRLQSAEESVRLTNDLDDFALDLFARFIQALLLHVTGAVRDATEIYTAIVTSLTGERELNRFGWPGIASIMTLGFLTWSLVMLGEFERARQAASRAMALVDRIRDHESVVAYSKAYAYWGFGLYQSATGQVQAAIDSFEAASLIVRQTDTVIPISPHWLAWAYTQGGRASDALALLLDAEKEMACSSSGLFPYRVHHYMALAETHLALGAVAEARTAIGRAQKIAEHTGELPTWLRSFGLGVASKRPIVHPICALPAPFMNAPSNSPVPEVCARWLLNVWLAWRRLGMSKVMLLTAADYKAQAQLVFDELKVLSSPSL